MKISINFLKKKKYMYDPKCFTVFKKLKTNNINKCSEVHTCVVIKAKKKKISSRSVVKINVSCFY